MADNFLEYHREEYERRKARWLAKKKHIKMPLSQRTVEKPEDESL